MFKYLYLLITLTFAEKFSAFPVALHNAGGISWRKRRLKRFQIS